MGGTVIKGILENNDGSKIILVGLSHENVARLFADEPIVFDLVEFGMSPQKFCIVAGETEQSILDDLSSKVPSVLYQRGD